MEDLKYVFMNDDPAMVLAFIIGYMAAGGTIKYAEYDIAIKQYIIY